MRKNLIVLSPLHCSVSNLLEHVGREGRSLTLSDFFVGTLNTSKFVSFACKHVTLNKNLKSVSTS